MKEFILCLFCQYIEHFIIRGSQSICPYSPLPGAYNVEYIRGCKGNQLISDTPYSDV